MLQVLSESTDQLAAWSAICEDRPYHLVGSLPPTALANAGNGAQFAVQFSEYSTASAKLFRWSRLRLIVREGAGTVRKPGSNRQSPCHQPPPQPASLAYSAIGEGQVHTGSTSQFARGGTRRIL